MQIFITVILGLGIINHSNTFRKEADKTGYPLANLISYFVVVGLDITAIVFTWLI